MATRRRPEGEVRRIRRCVEGAKRRRQEGSEMFRSSTCGAAGGTREDTGQRAHQSPRSQREQRQPQARRRWKPLSPERTCCEHCEQVERNAGAAGVDRMTTEELRGYLRARWGAAQEATPGKGPISRRACAAGGYPQAGGRDENAGNSDGRGPSLIQQAMHQVMSPVWKPDFSNHKLTGRSARTRERIRRWKPPGLTSSRDAPSGVEYRP